MDNKLGLYPFRYPYFKSFEKFFFPPRAAPAGFFIPSFKQLLTSQYIDINSIPGIPSATGFTHTEKQFPKLKSIPHMPLETIPEENEEKSEDIVSEDMIYHQYIPKPSNKCKDWIIIDN